MEENTTNTANNDDTRIDIDDPKSVYHWSKTFGITATALRKIVATVGPMVADVKKELGHKEKSTTENIIEILKDGFGSLQI